MSVIIKKERYDAYLDKSSWDIVYNNGPLPVKVSVLKSDDLEIRNFLFKHFGVGNYYVYRLGGNPQYQQYFKGRIGV